MTCLIIFSGSSARSTMSFRFARIKVLTRSKSPMMNLLPTPIDANHSNPQTKAALARRYLVGPPSEAGRSSDSRQKIHAANPRRKLHQPGQRNKTERYSLLKRPDRPAQIVVKQESDRHHHENPNDEKFFFPGHCHPPRAFSAPVGHC